MRTFLFEHRYSIVRNVVLSVGAVASLYLGQDIAERVWISTAPKEDGSESSENV